MYALQKFNRKSSSRHQIAIKGVEDDILILPNNEYRVIINIDSINLYLMNKEEQIAIIELYKGFLNSLSFPIQILQKAHALDIDDYLQGFEDKKEKESVEIYRNQIDSYIKYVRSLVETYGVLTHQFYLIIPYRTSGKEGIDAAREQLDNRLSIVKNGLNNMGIKTRLLNSLEILDLFYSSYNIADAKKQPLTHQTIDLLKQNYF